MKLVKGNYDIYYHGRNLFLMIQYFLSYCTDKLWISKYQKAGTTYPTSNKSLYYYYCFSYFCQSSIYQCILCVSLTGWLFDQTLSYTASFLVLSAMPLLTTIPYLVLDIQRYIGGRRSYMYSPVP